MKKSLLYFLLILTLSFSIITVSQKETKAEDLAQKVFIHMNVSTAPGVKLANSPWTELMTADDDDLFLPLEYKTTWYKATSDWKKTGDPLTGSDAYAKGGQRYLVTVEVTLPYGGKFAPEGYWEFDDGIDYGESEDAVWEGSENWKVSDKKISVTKQYIGSKYISCDGCKLSKDVFYYNGKEQKAKVTIKGLKEGTDFKCTYSNHKKVGVAKVVVKGIGNYKGSDTLGYVILPKKPVIKSITAGKKQMTVKMTTKPSSCGVSAYRVYYRVKGTKTWTNVKVTGTSKTIKSLKKGKKYEVFVDAYKGDMRTKTAVKTSKAIK